MSLQPSTPDGVPFVVEMRPARTLSIAGIWIIVSAYCLVAIPMGLLFMTIGAWPIAGFYGVDVAVLAFALFMGYRAGRRYERVVMTPADTTIERGNHRGSLGTARFDTPWLAIRLLDAEHHHCRLVLSCKGRRIVVGGFLAPGERRQVAEALGRELRHQTAKVQPHLWRH